MKELIKGIFICLLIYAVEAVALTFFVWCFVTYMDATFIVLFIAAFVGAIIKLYLLFH